MVKDAACVEEPSTMSVPVETCPTGTPEAQKSIEAMRADNHRSLWLIHQLRSGPERQEYSSFQDLLIPRPLNEAWHPAAKLPLIDKPG